MIVPHDAKPVLMSAPMILSLDRKTQTRRTGGLEDIKRSARLVGYGRDHRGRFAADFDDPEGDGCYLVVCPYGGPGSTLWVREGVRRVGERMGYGGTRVVDYAEYIADGAPAPLDYWGWKSKALPGIHMPKGLCRFLLHLTDVRVERLHDITEADAVAEGIEPRGVHPRDGKSTQQWAWPGAEAVWWTARDAYRAGWVWLHGEASWGQNPYVWTLSFSVTKR